MLHVSLTYLELCFISCSPCLCVCLLQPGNGSVEVPGCYLSVSTVQTLQDSVMDEGVLVLESMQCARSKDV